MPTTHASPRSKPARRRSGPLVRAIENQAAQLPSNPLFWAALGSVGMSMLFRLPLGRSMRRLAGRWVVPIVFMGLYQGFKGRTAR